MAHAVLFEKEVRTKPVKKQQETKRHNTETSIEEADEPRYNKSNKYVNKMEAFAPLVRAGFEPSINKSLHSSSSAAPFSKCPVSESFH